MRNILAAVALVAGVVSLPSTVDAQNCPCVCRFEYGRRVCRRVCYVPPQPHYEAPRYSAPYQSYSPPSHAAPSASLPRELPAAVLVLLAAGALIAFLAHMSSIASVRSETAAVQEDTIATRELSNRANHTAQEIDAFVDHSAREHYARGRAAADEEWSRA